MKKAGALAKKVSFALLAHPFNFLTFFISFFSALIVSAHYQINSTLVESWPDFYLILLLLTAAVLSVWSTLRKNHHQIKWNTWIWFTAIFVFCLLIRLTYLESVPVWLDEEYQAWSAINLPSFVHAGGTQHQPPLDIVFSYLGQHWLGISTTGVRIHAVIFSALVAGSFFIWLRSVSLPIWLSLLTTATLFWHLLVFRYGYECRPVSLALLTSIMFFYELTSFLKNYKSKSIKTYFLALTATAVLMLLAIGLQPPFLLLATLIAGIFCFFKNKKIAYLLVSTSTAAVTLFIPIQLYVFKVAEGRIKPQNGSYLVEILHSFRIENFDRIIQMYNPFFLLNLISALVFLYFLRGKKIKNTFLNRALPGVIAYLFFITLVPFFKATIAWWLNDYYTLCALPLLIFSVVTLTYALIHKLKKVMPFYAYQAIQYVVVFAFTILCWHTYHWGGIAAVAAYEPRSQTQTLYDYLSEKAQPNDLIVSFCAEDVADFCPDDIPGIAISLHGSNLDKIATDDRSSKFDAFINIFDEDNTPRQVFVVYLPFWSTRSDRPIPKKSWDKYHVLNSNDYDVYLFSGVNGTKKIYEFYRELWEKTQEIGYNSFSLTEPLVFMEARFGNPERLQKIWQTYLNFNPQNKRLWNYKLLKKFIDKHTNLHL